jgi:hypothetical protein
MNEGNLDESSLMAAALSTEEASLPSERRAARVKRRDVVQATTDAAPARGAWPESTRDRNEREMFDAVFHGAMLARRRLGLRAPSGNSLR